MELSWLKKRKRVPLKKRWILAGIEFSCTDGIYRFFFKAFGILVDNEIVFSSKRSRYMAISSFWGNSTRWFNRKGYEAQGFWINRTKFGADRSTFMHGCLLIWCNEKILTGLRCYKVAICFLMKYIQEVYLPSEAKLSFVYLDICVTEEFITIRFGWALRSSFLFRLVIKLAKESKIHRWH